MQQNSYRNTLYFIAFVILVTLSIQVYWNFKNYESSKRQLINEVQISLDNAVDNYYAELAEKNTLGLASKSKDISNVLKQKSFKDFIHKIDSGKTDFSKFELPDSIDHTQIRVFKGGQVAQIDSILKRNQPSKQNLHIEIIGNKDSTELMNQSFNIKDSLDTHFIKSTTPDTSRQKDAFKILTSKIVFSITEDSLNLKKLDSLLALELKRKSLDLVYGIKYTDPENHISFVNQKTIDDSSLKTDTKSSYLPKNSSLYVYFTNTTIPIFRKNLIGLLLSFLLITAVISCLLYLLRIIKHQKQLSELKNDLISNITHEFKTPITTATAAIEAIQNFNAENDLEKTSKYLDISSNQLLKLNTMVEKILETAAIHNHELQLDPEEINLVKLILEITNKYQAQEQHKQLTFQHLQETVTKKVDVFHFENAISNIVDNAYKYGGDQILIKLLTKKNEISIEIIDNGNIITKNHKDKIFEKFYRIPSGNTHDVKGFGIGLYYTKTIIEKHQGALQLLTDQHQTNFEITLPND